MYDVSPRKRYSQINRLDEQIARTGHSIKDVKAVIMGHLRITPCLLNLTFRCGSLWRPYALYGHQRSCLCSWQGTHQRSMVPFHQSRRRSISTILSDTPFKPANLQQPSDRDLSRHLNAPLSRPYRGTLWHAGSWFFSGDQFHVSENYTKQIPQGFLGRDKNTWFQSLKYIQRLERVLDAQIVFGHDVEQFKTLKQSPEYYS